METSQAIRKLLFLEDCVIIPGLGGFVARYRPAVIDKTTGTFIPPSKEIVFNNELLQNDGILVSFLANQNGITIERARQDVDVYVEEAKKKLAKGSSVFIDGVGHFFRDKNQDIRFQSDPGTNLLPDSYGLASFNLKEIRREIIPVVQNILPTRNEEAPVTVEFTVNTPRKSNTSRNLRRIAIAMPLLIVFSLLPYHSRVTDTLTSSSASMLPEASLFRLNYPDPIPADTSRVIEYPIGEAVATDTLVIENEPVKEEVKSETVASEVVKVVAGKFPVIAGCFKVEENAIKLHKQLVDKGYPATITPSRTGLFKVSVQSFATRQEAIDGLARLKKAEPGMQLWAAI
jgi:nucleoid DNA-binding protein